MEERGYVAEALLERLRADGVAFRLIGDSSGFPESAPEELDIAVPREALGATPRLVARFAQDFDFRLVELARLERGAWRAVLAWTDEVGRPRFMGAHFFVAAEEGAGADALFISGLIDGTSQNVLTHEPHLHDAASKLCPIRA